MSEVTVTIDGQSVSVPKGTLIVEAARKIGIEIPVYCYHPKLEPVGACRVCVVNVEGQRRPIMPACATEVAQGMVIHTRDKAATAAREGVLELLLINHPLDCPVCDRAGECDLQDFTQRYGPTKSRFKEIKRHFEKSVTVGKEVVLDRERCIMCMRCVRFCDEVAMEEGLTIIERGPKAEIGPFPGHSFDSQFSGNTVEICPVGALTSHSYRFKSRPWELQNFASVCNGCSVGCNLTVDVRYDHVARLRSRVNDNIDDGWLCDKGRYSYPALSAENRLKTPMIRKDGKLEACSWNDVLAALSTGLKKYSGAQIGAIAGPTLGNEASWSLMRLMRSTIKSGNLDHAHGKFEPYGQTQLPISAKISGLDKATCVVVFHSKPSEISPVLELRIKKAISKKNAGLIVIGDAGALNQYADVRLSDTAELIGALHSYEEPEKPPITHPKPRPWDAGGKTSDSVEEAVKLLKRSNRVTIVLDETSPLAGLRDLGESVDCMGRAPHGLLMVANGANTVGQREMGLTSQWAAGGQKLSDAAGGFSESWGSYNSESGKRYAEMSQGDGVSALISVHHPALPKKPEYLVVVGTHLDEAANQADVVLPAAAWTEQVLTVTNMDGTLQPCRQALPPPGEAYAEWKIFKLIAANLGDNWKEDSASEVFAEIGRLNPLYSGASYRQFQVPAEVHWSYPQQSKMGTPRADLSGIPNRSMEATPWMGAPATGSKVERVGRLMVGDQPPQVPGQEDPRRVAARMALEKAFAATGQEARSGPSNDAVLERLSMGSSPQPPGPSPAQRYHALGVLHREDVPQAPVRPEEPLPTEEEVKEESKP